jgi:hypothetical protein
MQAPALRSLLLEQASEDDPSTSHKPDVAAALQRARTWLAGSGVRASDGLGVSGVPDGMAEVLVDVAEVAARQKGDFGVARESVELFFLADPPRNQVGGPRDVDAVGAAVCRCCCACCA